MGACTIQTDRSSMMALKQRLKITETRKTPPYTIYQIKTGDCVITAYESGKLVFQENGAEECAVLIALSATQKTQSGATAEKTQRQPKAIHPQAGGDEVGTGDYSGPVTVCVICIHHKDVEFLRSPGVQGSKAIGDITIRRMVLKLME